MSRQKISKCLSKNPVSAGFGNPTGAAQQSGGSNPAIRREQPQPTARPARFGLANPNRLPDLAIRQKQPNNPAGAVPTPPAQPPLGSDWQIRTACNPAGATQQSGRSSPNPTPDSGNMKISSSA